MSNVNNNNNNTTRRPVRSSTAPAARTPAADNMFADFNAAADEAAERSKSGGKKYDIQPGLYLVRAEEFAAAKTKAGESKYTIKYRIEYALDNDTLEIDQERTEPADGATVTSHFVTGSANAETKKMALGNLALNLRVLGADMSAIRDIKTMLIEGMSVAENSAMAVAYIKLGTNGKNYNVYVKEAETITYLDNMEADADSVADMFGDDNNDAGDGLTEYDTAGNVVVEPEPVTEKVVVQPSITRRRLA